MTVDTSEYGLGRIPSTPDPRIARFTAQPAEDARNRPRKYWFMDQVFHQHRTPYCVSYTGVATLVAAPIRNFPAISFEELYRMAQENDQWAGNAYEGSSILGLCKSLKKLGFIDEYRWATSVEQVADYVLTKAPMAVGTTFYDDMFDPDEYGFMHPGGVVAGGHAYTLIGCDREKKCPDGSIGAFRILNSWGRTWSQNGRAWISMKDFAFLLADQGEAATFIEKKLN